MGLLKKIFRPNSYPDELIIIFERELQIQRDHLFGITLFSQGIELMYANQPDILENNRKSFQNIKDRTESIISTAETLLQNVKDDPGRVRELKRFKLPPIGGNPMLNQMAKSAKLLVDTYERIFPGRPRSKPLTNEEKSHLMKEIAEQI